MLSLEPVNIHQHLTVIHHSHSLKFIYTNVHVWFENDTIIHIMSITVYLISTYISALLNQTTTLILRLFVITIKRLCINTKQ